jgi:hypothetical protein
MTLAAPEPTNTAPHQPAREVVSPPAATLPPVTAHEDVTRTVGAALTLTPTDDAIVRVPATSAPAPQTVRETVREPNEPQPRLGPQGDASRRHTRVIEAQEGSAADDEAGPEEPVMTATGRSGTISTTDFE